MVASRVVMDHHWTVVSTDQPPRFGLHVIRGLYVPISVKYSLTVTVTFQSHNSLNLELQ